MLRVLMPFLSLHVKGPDTLLPYGSENNSQTLNIVSWIFIALIAIRFPLLSITVGELKPCPSLNSITSHTKLTAWGRGQDFLNTQDTLDPVSVPQGVSPPQWMAAPREVPSSNYVFLLGQALSPSSIWSLRWDRMCLPETPLTWKPPPLIQFFCLEML